MYLVSLDKDPENLFYVSFNSSLLLFDAAAAADDDADADAVVAAVLRPLSN